MYKDTQFLVKVDSSSKYRIPSHSILNTQAGFPRVVFQELWILYASCKGIKFNQVPKNGGKQYTKNVKLFSCKRRTWYFVKITWKVAIFFIGVFSKLEI